MADRSPAPPAPDKLAFLLALVPWLIANDAVTVTATARHFDVPESQVREAVLLIAVSGVPGETNFYQHGDLFDIAWDRFEEHDEIVLTNLVAIDDSPRFSAREAAALIAGLQYLSTLPENADSEVLASLTAKLARGSSSTLAPVVVQPNVESPILGVIRQAVAEGLQLEFDYVKSTGQTEHRRVDPLRIDSQDSVWYLRAWCHSRDRLRVFRLDRMTSPVLTTLPSVHSVTETALPETLFDGTAGDIDVTLELPQAALLLIADYVPSAKTAPQVQAGSDGAVRVVIRVSHFHGLKRLVAGLPGLVTVIAPVEARRAVAEWAAAGAGRYAR